MKTKRSILSLVLVLILCVSLAVSASAATVTRRAGIYGTLTGTANPIVRSTLIPTTTTITTNPDTAYIEVNGEVTNGESTLDAYCYTSNRGVTSFSTSVPVYVYGQYAELIVYINHCVQGGSESPVGYVAYNQVTLS